MSRQTCGGIILAGGKRALREDALGVPKLLEQINDVPVLGHIIDSFMRSSIPGAKENTTVIISARFESVLRTFITSHFPKVNIAVQLAHDGTARAIMEALEQHTFPNTDRVMILMGDQPLFTPKDMFDFYQDFLPRQQVAGLSAFRGDRSKPEFIKCGKIFLDTAGNFVDVQPRVPVISNNELLHAGPYLFDAKWLKGILALLKKWTAHHNAEIHLYEALVAAAAGSGVAVIEGVPPTHCLGVDTLAALEEVRHRMPSK